MSYFLDLLFEDFYEIFDMVPKWGGGRGGGGLLKVLQEESQVSLIHFTLQ